MLFNEKIISKCFVKPSSPTPSRFRNHKLNFLDQISPMMYIPFVFFYQNDESKPNQHVQLLKQSLSQILTIYYPLAGRIKENLFVDCNDTGVEFVEARVHTCIIAQFIEDPKMSELKHLIPVDCLFHSTDNAILSVKASFFDCGGIALGVCLSHKVADFASLALFVHAWSAQCRGETQIIQPSFDLAIRFPPKGSIPSGFTPDKEKITTNRLVFDKNMLDRLKQQAASGEVRNPTTVEALSIFICQNSIEATKPKKSSSLVVHAVNLRPRTNEPMLNHAFGNFSILCFGSTSNLEDYTSLLFKLRASIRAIDDDYIKELTGHKYLTVLNEITELLISSTNSCSFSSYSRFPMYDVDFGWGKPVWASLIAMPYKNTVYLMSTPSGNGIEAWINMSDYLFQILKTNYNKLLN